MNRPLLIVRPEPGNRQSVKAAIDCGLNAIGCPLFEICALPWSVPDDLARYDGMLFTSANAALHIGVHLAKVKHLTAYCVGGATATAAKQMGFDVADIGVSGVDNLLLHLPPKNLLHLCGSDKVRMRPHPHRINAVAVYSSVALPAPPIFFELTSRPLAIALHSPRAALRVSELVADRAKIALVAISQATANAAGAGWQAVAVAANPRDEEILATAKIMTTA